MRIKASTQKIIHNKMMKAVFILFSASSLFDMNYGQHLTYEEVRALSKDCSPLDTCSSNRNLIEDDLLNNLCECKPSCSKYNTCCVDSPNNLLVLNNTTLPWENSLQETCVHIEQGGKSIFMKNRCKLNGQYEDQFVSLCENQIHTLSDPMLLLPVTNPSTSITYKNYFCALCNDDVEGLVYWNIKLQKFVSSLEYDFMSKYDESKIVENLVYDDTTDEWGFMDTELKPLLPISQQPSITEDSDSEKKIFRSVSLVFEYPSDLKNSITHCEMNLISECDPSWDDDTVKNKCNSYMSMIYAVVNTPYSVLPRFRNVHCAICNFASGFSEFPCFMIETAYELTMSLAWLLDVNLRDGYIVGEVNGCKAGDTYDPFFKKCRTMVCMKSGYVVRNGKCYPA